MIQTDQLDHISLFSGLGGFDLAAEIVGWNNAAHCEINPFARRILKYYWPNALSYGSIIDTDFSIWRGRIFCLSGGFPCQPFSHAGKRAGTLDGRYLWPEYFRAIREIQPATVVGENVTGILSMAEREVFARVDSRKNIRWEDFDEYEAVYTRQEEMLVGNIIKDLESEGYRVQLFNIPAAGKGAPHKRERIWFAAYSDLYNDRRTTRENEKEGKEKWLQERNELRKLTKSGEIFGNATDPKSRRHGGLPNQIEETRAQESNNPSTSIFRISDASDTSRQQLQRSKLNGGIKKEGPSKSESRQFSGSICSDWKEFPTQPPLCGRNDGLPTELDGITFSKWRNESIKGYGNAIVPQVAVEIFKALDRYANSNK